MYRGNRGRGRARSNNWQNRNHGQEPIFGSNTNPKPLSTAQETRKWARILSDETVLAKLDLLTTTAIVLKGEGYTVSQPSNHELWTKMRCQNCGDRLKHYRPHHARSADTPGYDQETVIAMNVKDRSEVDLENKVLLDDKSEQYKEWRTLEETRRALDKQAKMEELVRSRERLTQNSMKTKHKCMFHDGNFTYGQWNCCGGRPGTQGCTSQLEHRPCSEEELYKLWQFEGSPEVNITEEQQESSTTVKNQRPQAYSSNNDEGSNASARAASSLGSVDTALPRRRSRRPRYMNFMHLPASQQPQAHYDLMTARRAQNLPLAALDSRSPTKPRKCKAVALDCEMGSSKTGSSELIRLTLVDLFSVPVSTDCQTGFSSTDLSSTPTVLIDTLISPTVPISNYNTRYSGVTHRMMITAINNKTCIFGINAARAKLFECIDKDTFVIVHGGSSDFNVLRWLHPVDRIIDTLVLEKWDELCRGPEFSEKKVWDEKREKLVREKGMGKTLKEVVARRCGIEVQQVVKETMVDGRVRKLTGHDSVEDALGCREVIGWWLSVIDG